MKNLVITPDHRNSIVYDTFKTNFIDYMPTLLDYAISFELCEKAKELMNSIDYVNYHYRKYLAQSNGTLHRVFTEIRYLQKCFAYKPFVLKSIIEEIEKMILQNELYELMPKHLKAKEKIFKTFLQGQEIIKKTIEL